MRRELETLAAGGHPTHLLLDISGSGRRSFCRSASDGNTHRYICDQPWGRLVLDMGLDDWSVAIWVDLIDSRSLLWRRAGVRTLRAALHVFSRALVDLDAYTISSAVDVHEHCDNF